jgi:hypothetical protein
MREGQGKNHVAGYFAGLDQRKMRICRMRYVAMISILCCSLVPRFGFADADRTHKFVDKIIAAIPVGTYSEQKVIDLYGKGIHIQGGSALCYFNKKERSYLVVEYGPDKVVESVAIIAENYTNQHNVCKQIEINATLAASKGLKLGDSPEHVIEIYGLPQKRANQDGSLVFEYHTDYSEDKDVALYYDALLHFLNGKLTKLYIHDGE